MTHNQDELGDYIIGPDSYSDDPDRFKAVYPMYTALDRADDRQAYFGGMYDLEKIIDDYPELRKTLYGE